MGTMCVEYLLFVQSCPKVKRSGGKQYVSGAVVSQYIYRYSIGVSKGMNLSCALVVVHWVYTGYCCVFLSVIRLLGCARLFHSVIHTYKFVCKSDGRIRIRGGFRLREYSYLVMINLAGVISKPVHILVYDLLMSMSMMDSLYNTL